MSVARRSAGLTALNALTQVASFFLFAAVAALFGADWQTDAFFLALTIPALLINPLNNSITSALIPLLTKYRIQQPEALGRVTGSVLIRALLFSSLTAGVMALLAPVALGLVGGHLTEQTERLARSHILLLLPMVVAQTAASVLGAAFNSAGRFTAPAIASAVRYGATLVFVVILRPELGVTSLPVAFSIGSVIQLMLLVPLRSGRHTPVTLAWAVDPPVQRHLLLALPLTAANTLQQLGFLVSRLLAATLPEGSVSVFDYASRLSVGIMEFVTSGVFLVALADWSEVAARDRVAALRTKLAETISIVAFVLLPIVACVIALRRPLVSLVFEHGRFGSSLTLLTASMLWLFAVAMPFDALARCYLRVLLVWDKLWLVSALAVLRLVVTASAAVALLGVVGVRGLAVADSVAVIGVTIIVGVYVERRLGPALRHVADHVLRIAIAALVTFLVTAGATFLLTEHRPIVILLAATAAGVSTYLVGTHALGLEEPRRLVLFIRTWATSTFLRAEGRGKP